MMEEKGFSEISAAVLGGLIGSLSMYLLIRVGDISTRIYERQKQNFNALVRLEYLCCENLDNISSNVYIIDDFIDTAEVPLKKNEPIIYGNKLSLISFDDSLILDFAAVDLINKVFEYKVDITKANHDINGINEMYETFKSALIRRDINFQTYRDNALMAIGRCKQLKIFFGYLEEKTVRLAACSALLSREHKPFLTRIIHCFLRNKVFIGEFNKKLDKEVIRVQRDREEVMKDSEAELKDIKEKIQNL